MGNDKEIEQSITVLRSIEERTKDIEADVQDFESYLDDINDQLAKNIDNIVPKTLSATKTVNKDEMSWSDLVLSSKEDLKRRRITISERETQEMHVRLKITQDDIDPEGYLDTMIIPDIIVSILAGVGGAALAWGLEEVCDSIHRNHYIEDFSGKIMGEEFANHAKNGIPLDRIPGRPFYGGFWHRLSYGHNILNPTEAWSEMKAHFGGPVEAALGWLIHQCGDMMSKEGLPLPGTPWCAALIKELSGNNIKRYQELFTIKGRDLAGSVFISGVLGAYRKLWRRKGKKGVCYSDFQTAALAHGVCAAVGWGLGSLNWFSITAVVKNLVQMFWHTRRVDKFLDKRNEMLLEQISRDPEYGPPLEKMLMDLEGWDDGEVAYLGLRTEQADIVARTKGLKLVVS